MASAMESLAKELDGKVELSFDQAHCRLFGQDVFHEGKPVAAIARPSTPQAVATLVEAINRLNFDITVRGGGASYSGGYLSPDPQKTVAIDLSALEHIVSIDPDNMFVVVEAGCTWAKLDAALAAKGLRAAWWGPMSGRQATVGGALSQNAIFWGSGEAGFAADSVLALEVMTMEGGIVRTGSWSIVDALPFTRHFGPDLTGLFLGDCGALGIKLRAVLRLVERRSFQSGLSFTLPSFEDLAALLSACARKGIVAQMVGFDEGMKQERLKRASIRQSLNEAANLLRSALRRPSQFVRLARMAVAGRKVLDASPWSAHIFLEDHTSAGLAGRQASVRRLAAQFQATEVAPTIPSALAANPFPPLNGLVGPAGERWVPIHCVVPHTRALAAHAAIEAEISRVAAQIERLSVRRSTLFSTAGSGAFIIEPMFFWRDDPGAYHREVLPQRKISQMQADGDSAEARALVTQLRKDIARAVDQLGSSHIQIGATYAYGGRLHPESRRLFEHLRKTLDPKCRLNQSALRG